MNYLIPLKHNLKNSLPSHPYLYNLIQGIPGIGVYSLNNIFLFSFLNLTKTILRLLINLTKPIKIEKRMAPGWYVPCSFLHLEEEKTRYAKGNFNLGLSHGDFRCLLF